MKQKEVIFGLFWKFAERIGAQGVSLIVSIILARLIAPEEYGIIALTTIFIAISNVFVESGLGTALIEVLKLKDKRVMIIGETQYDWYVSYMAMLCGVGLVVPTDKELPVNEIENIAKRSKVSAIIYSPKKEDDIEKVKSSLPDVEYYIEMKSDDGLSKDEVGIKNLIKLGKAIVNGGNKKFEKIKINPDEFRILFWTSGTTSNSKGVMLSNRNLAENINAVSAYVKVYPTDRFFSVLPLHHCYESTIGFLLPMAHGSSIAVCEGLRYVAQNMQEARPTAMLAVPLLIESLYKKINEKIVKNKKDKLVNSMMQFIMYHS